MKKIMILVGPALAYLICYIIYGFRQSIFSQADIPVTVLFLLECVGYCVIGMLLLIVSEAIRKEIRDQGTKILCGVDIIVPLVIWIFGIKTGNFIMMTNGFVFVYFVFLGGILYSIIKRWAYRRSLRRRRGNEWFWSIGFFIDNGRNYNMDCEKNLRLYQKLTLNNSYSL